MFDKKWKLLVNFMLAIIVNYAWAMPTFNVFDRFNIDIFIFNPSITGIHSLSKVAMLMHPT